MPVWLVFGVQSSASVTVTGAAPLPLPALADGVEDEQAATPPPTVVARANASAIRVAVRRMLVTFIVSRGVRNRTGSVGDADSDADSASFTPAHAQQIYRPIHHRSAYRVHTLSPNIGLLRP